MTIRKTQQKDLNTILPIYAHAREQMKRNGNPSQWGSNRPSKETLLTDIQNAHSYVIEENEEICGAFSFFIGEDPTYRILEHGQWLNDAPYGTIHRLAGNGKAKGIFNACLAYCMTQIPNIRIDTHQDNLTMRHLLEKNGFTQCGTIYAEDNTPRIAYQKTI